MGKGAEKPGPAEGPPGIEEQLRRRVRPSYNREVHVAADARYLLRDPRVQSQGCAGPRREHGGDINRNAGIYLGRYSGVEERGSDTLGAHPGPTPTR